MTRVSPIFRISIGLAAITLSLLLTANFIGLTPNNTEVVLEQRKKVCEALAVQFSRAAQLGQTGLIETTLASVVGRNPDILSSAIRLADGELLIKVGDHEQVWQGALAGKSTPTHVRVPILRSGSLWGMVELGFTPLISTGLMGIPMSTPTLFALFIALSGFICFLFFIKKVFRHLDPAAIIPARVQMALDALPAGVVVMDDQERVVLANTAFSRVTGRTVTSLLGRRISKMGWLNPDTERKVRDLPWVKTIVDGEKVNGVALRFIAPGESGRTYIVNNSPILDANNKARGVLVSFDDITSIQDANVKMRHALSDLQSSRAEVDQQNKKLRVLATCDSLTGCLNRRSFFEKFDEIFSRNVDGERSLSCIMLDIDHFKNVNDSYGHLVGDQVIRLVAESVEGVIRDGDYVCRYGGEEFCILLPGSNIVQATTIAERCRFAIRKDSRVKLENSCNVTVSLGVSSLENGAKSPVEIINQADSALYKAKQCGRNRVELWDSEIANSPIESKASPVEDQVGKQLADHDKGVEIDDEVLKPLYDRIMDLEDSLAEQSQEAQHYLTHDDLTGLPNRSVYRDRISQALATAKRAEQVVAVMSLDTNMFRRVNDTLGESMGDRLLKSIGERLTQGLRDVDTVAELGNGNVSPTVSRINGDEFGILLTGLVESEPVAWVVKRISDLLENVFDLDGRKIYLNSRIGVSLFPNDGDDADTLVRKASMARFLTQNDTDNSKCQFYANEMNDIAMRHIQLENDLRKAMDNEEFLLNYQPKVNLRTGQIDGMEALIRWQHPEFGIVPPDEFIPAAERTGVIVDLGAWVLRAACGALKNMHDKGFPGLRMAINVSSRQLRQDDWCDQIQLALREFNLQPCHLELEVTERSVVDCVDRSGETINELYRLGVRISIDDFGTGYSALNYLQKFPVDTLKIDRCFIRDIINNEHDRSIVIAIIEMARNLDITVLAEGVEEEEQLQLLRTLHCEEVQGYLFSRPVSVPEMLVLLKSVRSAGGVHVLLPGGESLGRKAG